MTTRFKNMEIGPQRSPAEVSLYAAVLERALVDYYDREVSSIKEQNRLSAEVWLFELDEDQESKPPITLDECLEVLNIDKAMLLRELKVRPFIKKGLRGHSHTRFSRMPTLPV